ncbi:MAG: thioredoxin family protein [Candidatus Zixiibacteriota bacterium]
MKLATCVIAVAMVVLMSEAGMAGWYVDSLKDARVVEIRGETADTLQVGKGKPDRYVEDNLDYLLANHEWLIVCFCAYWCGDCNNYKPDYVGASQQPEYAGIRWAWADVDGVVGNEGLRKGFELPGTPVTILFHQGQIIKAPDGSKSILEGQEGDKTYVDLIALLKKFYRP